MTEALLLVGGRGTRLHPLTLTRPKPMVPAAGVPIMEHLVGRARDAGVTRLVLATSYLPDAFRAHFGDGSDHGIELRYITEEQPLGTGGAIRHAAALLDGSAEDPVLIFNGDILSGLNIAGLVKRHQEARADVTLHLTRVDDPRAFGLVPTDEDGWVLDFREKPSRPEEIITDQINAGCYVFTRSVIDRIPAGREVSVEREVFPELLASGGRVLGVVDTSYWLDLGTPQAFVKGSRDLVRGLVPSPVLPREPGEHLVLPGADVAPNATLTGGTTIGRHAVIGAGAQIDGSVVMDGAVIGAGAVVESCVIGENATVADGAVLREAVVADGDHVPAEPSGGSTTGTEPLLTV